MKRFLWMLAAVAALPGRQPAMAMTMTLGAKQDATMFQNNPDNGSGGGNGLFAGTNGAQTSPRRALIAFDVAAGLPSSVVIHDVELTLFLGQFPNVGAVASSTIGLHPVTSSWGEGLTQLQTPPNDTFGGLGQGAAALDGDVTWNNRFHSATTPTAWTNPGGDFEPTSSASTVVTRNLNTGYVWNSTDALIDDVQGWLDAPQSNFGWMLKNADEVTPATFRGFYSSQTATPQLRPHLTVSFSLPGDFDHNDAVDAADLAAWQSNVGLGSGALHSQGDADLDGDVDGGDFLVWQRQVGQTPNPPAIAAIPEPATIGLLSIALAAGAWRRRTRQQSAS
ncbi:PEP-CTERM sorting domain-containing protein [Lacipirellula limnantheis]|uniref:PEP-CTERM motif protein n=1 Tax=Lacipirellula limnantheis TaxID=2528024 RepID=A0A517TT78_9BACT|nr:DNRLRE domain-containing protein [Lacipirellula limnantheis]QDT71580.1 PEP-CTERM motif protein [Lacipirellula limnantheis]